MTRSEIFDRDNQPVDPRDGRIRAPAPARIEKGNHAHFMQKEIFEQPIVVAQTLGSYLRPLEQKVALPDMDFSFADVPRITIVACGTSYYAGMVAKYWLERFARVPVELDIASRVPLPRAGAGAGRARARSSRQSGETADTLAALRHARAQGQKIAVVVNVPTSSMAREADLLLPTHAGPEIGVASTKAFTCQLAVLAALAAKVARDKGAMSEEEEREIVLHLTEAPAAMNAALDHDEDIAAMAPRHRRGPRRPLSRPRPGLSAGAGRRAEAEGDQLHPRRRLCRRRDEARPDRADRRQRPDHRPRALRAAVREDRLATCRRSRRAAARSS